MKKLLLLLMMMLLPMVTIAETVEIDGIYYNLVAKAEIAEVINNPNQYQGNIIIPESVKYDNVTYNVMSIGDYAFSDCTGLASVIIPNSVTGIGHKAFYGCTGLTSITIPSGITSIGEEAFVHSGITTVNILDLAAWCNITFIGSFANPLNFTKKLIVNGEEIKDLVIPSSVAKIGDCAFKGCSGIVSVTIPNSVQSIGDAAFDFCSGLTSVMIGNNVTTIGGCAFRSCSNLTSVTIPNSVTGIGDSSFYGCSGLTSIIIPHSVISIGNFAFGDCTGLTSVTIGNGVSSIGWRAFYGCSGLSYISLGTGLNTIYMYAFENCKELTNVYCHAEIVPQMIDNKNKPCANAFEGSYIEYATLHVTESSIEAYKTKEPWSNFKVIVKIMLKYNLTYIVDDEIYKSYQVEEGTTITPEAAPTKDGYTFSGWSEIPETMPAHDVVVHANYTTGIMEVLMSSQQNVRIYSPNGKKVNRLQKGLNIVVFDDGTVKKIVLK